MRRPQSAVRCVSLFASGQGGRAAGRAARLKALPRRQRGAQAPVGEPGGQRGGVGRRRRRRRARRARRRRLRARVHLRARSRSRATLTSLPHARTPGVPDARRARAQHQASARRRAQADTPTCAAPPRRCRNAPGHAGTRTAARPAGRQQRVPGARRSTGLGSRRPAPGSPRLSGRSRTCAGRPAARRRRSPAPAHARPPRPARRAPAAPRRAEPGGCGQGRLCLHWRLAPLSGCAAARLTGAAVLTCCTERGAERGSLVGVRRHHSSPRITRQRMRARCHASAAGRAHLCRGRRARRRRDRPLGVRGVGRWRAVGRRVRQRAAVGAAADVARRALRVRRGAREAARGAGLRGRPLLRARQRRPQPARRAGTNGCAHFQGGQSSTSSFKRRQACPHRSNQPAARC